MELNPPNISVHMNNLEISLVCQNLYDPSCGVLPVGLSTHGKAPVPDNYGVCTRAKSDQVKININ